MCRANKRKSNKVAAELNRPASNLASGQSPIFSLYLTQQVTLLHVQILRSRLALLLLLCFMRMLLPESWPLELHLHEHTTEEPSLTPGELHGKTVLSAEHTHCIVDNFCHIPFQPSAPVELPLVFAAYRTPTSVPVLPAWQDARTPAADSRGPPRRI